ncbi:hypothetical protein [Chitinophaga sancti]|uniref:Uncharacterized protein n=1 Tax=Chitinophaga sancti TaxID=1004 RepID=A0A1K1T220_9BACT|nr:hypothetical protein [Chitinophaga sancti]WQD59619.1 hypothetical protein U0033_17160 [Chitinophaga sancti]WQG88250.1 hypothetical protein SR876_25305 [Chitinophaga sancti]SFW90566.1 hypothetical protein SAMN05661012_06636 [Chitinophaga sancti]
MVFDPKGKFGKNGKFDRLKNETISVKEIAIIADFSRRHANRIKNKVCDKLGKPPEYLLTFGEFLSKFHRINPDILIDRFWNLRFGK